MQRVLSFPPPRGVGAQREFVSKRMCFAFMFSLGFLAFLGGFLLGRFVFDKELELSRIKFKEAYKNKERVFGVVKNYSKFNVSSVVDGISESSIQRYLRLLTNRSMKDSAEDNLRRAEILRDHLTSNGFDLVSSLIETQIQMAYPSSESPNHGHIVDESGNVMFSFNDSRTKYPESNGIVNRTVVEGDITYVNYGRGEDYQYLENLEIHNKNKIVLLRAGEITIAEKVAVAVEHGAKGILIFPDFEPTDGRLPLIAPADLAKLQAHYGNHIDKWAGVIPILEISAEDSKEIFKKLATSNQPPASWRGNLKETGMSIGPGFSNKKWTFTMTVSTINIVETFYTALGAMRGSQEPDRFVMLTHEKDFAKDEAESTSIIMELVRVLGELKSKGWTPHRSVVVAYWGAEGPNLHLSSHPSSVVDHILRKTVTYFEIDSTEKTEGNTTLAAVTPMLEKLFYESALTVPLQNPSADILSPLVTDNLFLQCGVPFLKMKRFSTKSLKDVATFWGVTTWRVIESYKLPFSLESYSEFFTHSIDVIEKRFQTTAQDHSILLDSLFQSVQRLIETIKSFEANWSFSDTSKSLQMRIMSDQLLAFSRFLLCGSDSNHSNQSSGYSIFSKSVTGTDDQAGFGGLQDLLENVKSTRTPQDFQQQVVTLLAGLVETINLTRETLGDGLETFITPNT